MRSPIHIRRADPAVMVTTQITTFHTLNSYSRPRPPKPIPIARDSIRARATVRYLVYSAIFLRPSAPSFCICSSAGMAMVRSCMMMDEVM